MGIRLSDRHLMYSLACVTELVSSPSCNVSMFIWLYIDVPFFISRCAASTFHGVMSGTYFVSVRIMVLCSVSCSSG